MEPQPAPVQSLASGKLTADEEGRQRSHESRDHEAPVNRVMGYRFTIQYAPDQSPALDAVNIGWSRCGRASRRQPRSYATSS
jgi:hypothetical protein